MPATTEHATLRIPGQPGAALAASCLLFAIGFLPSPTRAQDEGSAAFLSPEEVEWVRARPAIRFGADPSWPPFSIRAGEKLEGIDRDIVSLIEGRLGKRIDYVPTKDWEETLTKLRRGEIDFATGVANLPERPLGLLYTRPYSELPVAVIMRSDAPFFTSLEKVAGEGLLVAGPQGYAPTVYLENQHRNIRLLRTETSLDALRAVSEGRADATLENLGVASHLIRVHGLANLKIAGTTALRFDTAFGVREDLPVLRSILDKSLADLSAAERYAVAERWIHLDMSDLIAWRKVAVVCAIVVFGAAAVVALVASTNRRLAGELARRRTAEKSLRESEERFRHLFDTMDDAYFLTQPDGKIQFVNGTAVEMLKIGSRPVVERLNLGAFLKYPGEMERLLGRLRTDGRLRNEPVEFVRADGLVKRRRCHIRLLADSTGEDIGVEWLVRQETPDRAAAEPVCAG